MSPGTSRRQRGAIWPARSARIAFGGGGGAGVGSVFGDGTGVAGGISPSTFTQTRSPLSPPGAAALAGRPLRPNSPPLPPPPPTHGGPRGSVRAPPHRSPSLSLALHHRTAWSPIRWALTSG